MDGAYFCYLQTQCNEEGCTAQSVVAIYRRVPKRDGQDFPDAWMGDYCQIHGRKVMGDLLGIGDRQKLEVVPPKPKKPKEPE